MFPEFILALRHPNLAMWLDWLTERLAFSTEERRGYRGERTGVRCSGWRERGNRLDWLDSLDSNYKLGLISIVRTIIFDL